jgi:hypothetical protein
MEIEIRTIWKRRAELSIGLMGIVIICSCICTGQIDYI